MLKLTQFEPARIRIMDYPLITKVLSAKSKRPSDITRALFEELLRQLATSSQEIHESWVSCSQFVFFNSQRSLNTRPPVSSQKMERFEQYNGQVGRFPPLGGGGGWGRAWGRGPGGLDFKNHFEAVFKSAFCFRSRSGVKPLKHDTAKEATIFTLTTMVNILLRLIIVFQQLRIWYLLIFIFVFFLLQNLI